MSSTPGATAVEASCSAPVPAQVNPSGEARTRWVLGISAVMMVLELAVGWVTHSLALTADGWHMATHVGALGLSAAAYWYARTRSAETRFAFGTGKVYALAGFTSSTVLLLVSFEMVATGIGRLIQPETVDFADALPVAVIGLVVNLVSALVLGLGHQHTSSAHAHGHHAPHGHDHDHGHPSHGHDHHHHDHAHQHHDHAHHSPAHEHSHPTPTADAAGAKRAQTEALRKAVHEKGHDHNLRSAYLHVLADAFTSLLAILALVAGRYFALAWLDPVVALVAAAVILKWAWALISDCARQLIDLGPSTVLRERVRGALESKDGTQVIDLHLWHVGPTQLVCVASLSTSGSTTLEEYKRAVVEVVPVDHLTIEIAPRAS